MGDGDFTAASMQALMATSSELFSRHGFAAVSVARLAKTSGVSSRRVATAFPSKDELIMAVMDRAEERWWRSMEDELEYAGGDLAGRAAAVFQSLRRPDGARPAAILLLRACLELGEASGELVAHCSHHRQRLRSALRRALRVDAGHPAVDALLVRVDGLLLRSVLERRSLTTNEIELAADDFARAVSGPPDHQTF